MSGLVVLGNQSRIILEPGDEVVAVYYLLDIVNNARVPVNPQSPFVFDMPAGASERVCCAVRHRRQASMARMSSSKARSRRDRTMVQVACEFQSRAPHCS